MTILVLGLALALPAGLYLTLDTFRLALGEGEPGSVRLALYLKQGTTDEQARTLRKQLAQDLAVLEAAYISPEQGAEDFRRHSGLGETLDLLDVNPLPGVIELEPADTAPQAVQRLHERLQGLPGISQVRVDTVWLERLSALLDLGDRLLQGGGLLVGLMLVLAVGNTIRLLVVNRRDEIRVIKLVGGSDGFVILPFLYTGFWYGLMGGSTGVADDNAAALAGSRYAGTPCWPLSYDAALSPPAMGAGTVSAGWRLRYRRTGRLADRLVPDSSHKAISCECCGLLCLSPCRPAGAPGRETGPELLRGLHCPTVVMV